MREGKKREGTTMMRWRMRRDIVGEMVVYGGWCGRERERHRGRGVCYCDNGVVPIKRYCVGESLDVFM